MFRCGRFIFAQRSQVTNRAGIDWFRQKVAALGIKIIEISFDDPNPMHVDATCAPIGEGILITNPDRPFHQRKKFEQAGWRVVEAAKPTLPKSHFMPLSSHWLSMNTLVINGPMKGGIKGRILVEEKEQPMIDLYRSLDFEVIPVPFRNAYSLGGSFHCVSCDICREGELSAHGLDDINWEE